VAVWGTPPVHVTGDTLAVSDWNTIANNETFLAEAPYGLYYNSVAVTLVLGASTQITLGGTEASGYGFSVASNNAVVPIAGLYSTTCSVYISAAEVLLTALTYHNGSQIRQGSSGTLIGSTTSGLVKCAANDTLGFYVYQNGGAPATIAGSGSTYLHAFYVGST